MIRDSKKKKNSKLEDEIEYTEIIHSNGKLTKWGEELYKDYEKSMTVYDPVTKKEYIIRGE